jgi:cysteine desulfurase/selenocysteine lyase
VSEYYEKYCTNPHNNDSSLASKVNEKIKSTRELVANFLNVKNSNQIIFSSGATESLNLIINNVQLLLKPEDEVLITYAEHSSNLIP